MSQEKSSEVSIFAFLIIVVLLMVWGVSSWIGGERKGVVKFSDCREIITLKSDTFQKYYKNFTCEYVKTQSGRIMSGTCVHVDTSGGLFSDSNECKRAYVYDKKSELQCSKEYPYLGYDDKCYATWGYGRVDTINE